MSGTRRMRAIIAAMVMVVLVAGCTVEPDSARGERPESDAAGEEVSIAIAFAAQGIAVVEDVGAPWPDSALMVSPASAVDVMQAEVESGGGMPGSDLDELIPLPQGAVPFSYLVAAWLSDPTTERAEVARAWMPEKIDWVRAQSVWYPRAALLLFVADVMETSLDEFGNPDAAAHGRLPTSPPLAQASAGHASLLQAPCTTVSDFFKDTINAVFGAVQLPPDFLAKGGALGAVSGFLAALYNTAVALAKAALISVIESLTAPILNAIGAAVAIAGVVSHLSTYVLGVSMKVYTDRPIILDGREGFWWAVLDANKPLEPQLTDCLAALRQKPLRKIVEPGAVVDWTRTLPWKADFTVFGRETLLYTTLRTTVDPAERISLPWRAATDIESSQPVQLGSVGVRAHVPKGDVSQLLTTARRLLDQAIASIARNGGPLEGAIRAALEAQLGSILTRLETEILGVGRSVLTIVGSGTSPFEYRDPDPPGPPAIDDPECYVGEWRYAGLASNWIDFRRSSWDRFTLEIWPDGLYLLRVRGSVAGFDAGFEGSTSLAVGRVAGGVWAVTSPPAGTPLTVHRAASDFGTFVFGHGLSPASISCSADGITLTITGQPDDTYGSTVWRFRRA